MTPDQLAELKNDVTVRRRLAKLMAHDCFRNTKTLVPNGTDKQPTFRIADLSNPNLKPWVKEHMKKDIDEVLAGKVAFTAQSSCQPGGVPMFMGYGGGNRSFSCKPPRKSGFSFRAICRYGGST